MLQGFATIGLVVAVGWGLAAARVLDLAAQRVLSLVAFWVCSPALLLTVMQRTPLSLVLSSQLAGSAAAAATTMALYALAVSYTHLDVYKRQVHCCAQFRSRIGQFATR